MKVFIPVCGDEYLSFFDKGLLPSLSWPKNRLALYNAQFLTWTNCPDKFKGFTHLTGTLHEALLQVIEICLKAQEPLLMACPDFIFSEGSIHTLKSFAETPGTCVGFSHMRVRPSFLEEVNILKPMKSSHMVSLAVKHAHDSFRQAECIHPMANCRHSGMSWRRSHDLILMQHRLPSAFMVNFLPEDLTFFQNDKFDAWDHRWPSTWTGNRQRVIGSSDAAFMVEITPPNIGAPPISEVNPLERDAYDTAVEFHNVNRRFVSVWRMG